MKLQDYEIKHNRIVRESGSECTVLLKKDGAFPLQSAGKIAIYGSGARNTINGGSGSGEVNTRYAVSIEEGLIAAGFTVTSQSWLEAYEKEKELAKRKFLKEVNAEAKAKKQNKFLVLLGQTPSEPEYNIPLEAEGETALYVVARMSGEGADRNDEAGSIALSETEIRDILACNEKYKNFMLILNVGGVVDLSPVKSVKNILILSQLGSETGNILADILLGKQNPSGKLTTTWASLQEYPSAKEFGYKDDTRYTEGIYVGYRYFDTFGKTPLYHFGFGQSYTEFVQNVIETKVDGENITVCVEVKNIGNYAGKEVVQLYTSLPFDKLDEPFQVLSAFAKSSLLAPGVSETVQVSFALSDIAPYDAEKACYVLEAGNYILRVGNSSRNTTICAIVTLDETVSVLQVKNVLGTTDFEDLKAEKGQNVLEENLEHVARYYIRASDIPTRTVDYDLKKEIAPEIKALSDDQLIKMNLGAYNPKAGAASMVGSSGMTVAGAAGQTYMEINTIPSLVMADGPAGLRLTRQYAVDKKGIVHSMESTLPKSITDYLSKPMQFLVKLMLYHPKKTDEVREQYCTSLPIGTAVAQSFNIELAESYGKIVGEEMKHFGVHLWLAPAMNIHRSIQCGRNFEYYSEDPLVSGKFAAAITRGVQENPKAGTTIKHYACNNQERNRTQTNSMLSERAAREIYLKGYGICVKESKPKAVMTSYNLVNGIHTSEHKGLIEDILRAEYGHNSIVMTDWVVNGYESEKNCKHPIATAAKVSMGGGNLFMPGCQKDYENIQQGLQDGTVLREKLQVNATETMKLAKELT